ncbi:hypothetical protein BH10CYA1_BH10CYA1_03370 [soil metagenome]
MHKSAKPLKLVFALAIGALQTLSPVFADSPSLFLGECPRPKQEADAELVNRNGLLVSSFRIFNDKNVFKLVKNPDGSFTGTVTSAPILAKGVPANADITFVAFIYQPTIPKKTRSEIFVRTVQFLGQDAAPNIKAGVGGCELLGNNLSPIPF